MLPILSGGGDDAQEGGGFEGGAAHQGAVEVGFGQETGGVVRGDAAAVEDADVFGRGAQDLPQAAADEGVHLLGLPGGGGEAGADGPDRLIGQDQLLAGEGAQVGQALLQLLPHPGQGLLRLALLEGLADTADGAEAGAPGRP